MGKRVRFKKPRLRDKVGRFILLCFILPFYYGWKGLVWLYETLLLEIHETGNNGILGPGYHSWHTTRFSWGKLSFILVILFITIYFIFLR